MLSLWHFSYNERDVENRKRSSSFSLLKHPQLVKGEASICHPQGKVVRKTFVLDKALADFGHTGHRAVCYSRISYCLRVLVTIGGWCLLPAILSCCAGIGLGSQAAIRSSARCIAMLVVQNIAMRNMFKVDVIQKENGTFQIVNGSCRALILGGPEYVLHSANISSSCLVGTQPPQP